MKLASDDVGFLDVNNLRIFGETTKSIATIENTTVSKNKTEIFISNIERLFQSGEIAQILYANNQPVYVLDGSKVSPDTPGAHTLKAKIVGQISSVNINPKFRGLSYREGDPIIVYGGLNSNTGIGATAEVASVTKGSVTSVHVDSGGYGYTTNTKIGFANLNTDAQAPIAHVANFVTDERYDVGFIPTDRISTKTSGDDYLTTPHSGISLGLFANATHYISNTGVQYYFANNLYANATTQLSNALSFATLSTFPISSVIVDNGGGGITVTPTVTANSIYKTQDGDHWADLKYLGMLAPIQIQSGGDGYQANDVITISGGTGYGAYANVSNVDANGSITSISYVYPPSDVPHHYPLGGIGYNPLYPPSLTISSAAGANAIIYVPGILGDGASFTPTLDRVGSITTIKVIEPGEDYIATPNVSARVQDIYVTNLYRSTLPQKGDVIYQGADINTASYIATVDSVQQMGIFDLVEINNIYRLRVFNYTSKPNYTINDLNVVGSDTVMKMTNQYIGITDSRYDQSNGTLTYGTTIARATAKFLNGLVIDQGQYLNTDGQPSGFDILQNENYNNFTYIITLEKEIAKYKEILLNLLHPTGMKVIGRYAMKSNSSMDMFMTDALNRANTLSYYTGSEGSTATMSVDYNGEFTSNSSNAITFTYLAGSNIANYIFANSTIQLGSANGINVKSLVTSVDYLSNTVTIQDSVWLTIANVAIISGNSGTNIINIESVTDSFDIINDGLYSDDTYRIKDIIQIGDKIGIPNNTVKTVTSVDYLNNQIHLSSNLTSNSSGYLTVNKTTISSDGQIKIWNTVGIQYVPELITQDGLTLITQDGKIILLG